MSFILSTFYNTVLFYEAQNYEHIRHSGRHRRINLQIQTDIRDKSYNI